MVTAVVIAALIVCLVGAGAVSRGIRLVDYTSGRSSGTQFQIVMTLLGTLVGGFMFFGLPAMGYEAGLAGMAVGVGYAIGLILLALGARRIKSLCNHYRIDTIDDLMMCRYGPKTQVLSAVVNLVVFLAILSAQFVAISFFLDIFTDIDRALTLYFAVGVVVIYTTLSGFRGVILTDVYQVVILALSAVVIFWLTSSETPLERLQNLEPRYLNGTGYGVAFLVGVVVLFPLSLFCRSDLWQRAACAKDSDVMRRAYLVTVPVLLIFYGLLTMLGLFAKANEDPEAPYASGTAGLQGFLDVLDGSGLQGVAVTVLTSVLALGVFAALLSTADSYLNLIATSLSKVIRRRDWQEFESQNSEDRTDIELSLLLTTRLLCVVLGVVAFGVASVVPDIVGLLVGGVSVLFVLLPSVLAAIFSKSARSDGEGSGLVARSAEAGDAYAASISIVGGIIVYIAASVMLEEAKSAFVPAALVSVAAYAIVRLVRRGRHGAGSTSE